MFSRNERVIGKDNQQILKLKKITIVGLGGVGGYVAEMLTRLGIGELTIVDFDKIDISNINRQIIATTKNVGLYKTDEFEKRLGEINPEIIIHKKTQKITKENIAQVIEDNSDFVIDAIDDITAKVAIAKYCQYNKINHVSSMGTGNRYKGVPNFSVDKIQNTSYDKLAKKFREELKKENIKDINVVYSKQPAEKTDALGSIVYYPLMCAGTIVSYVINCIIK